MAVKIPTVTLNNGYEIPMIGLGTANVGRISPFSLSHLKFFTATVHYPIDNTMHGGCIFFILEKRLTTTKSSGLFVTQSTPAIDISMGPYSTPTKLK